MVQDGQEDVG